MNPIYLKIIILLILLGLSAFFSANETVFSSVNIIRLERYKNSGKRGAKAALKLSKAFDRTISTILIGNNIANILQTAIATKLFTDLYGINGVFISTIVMTTVILLFGEYIPKNIAKRNPEKYALRYSGFLSIFETILFPIVKILTGVNLLMKKLIKNKPSEPSMTEEELISVINKIEEEGVLEEKESDLIKSAITFDDVTITNIYTKKENITSIDIASDHKEILDMFMEYHYSRIPVYKGEKNNIVGILYEKDYLSEYIKGKGIIDIKKILHKPINIKSNYKISNLLTLFQDRKEHIAIITNNDNKLVGLITLEDALESLVGEIYDEHD